MENIDDSKITACGILLVSQDGRVLAFARKGDISKLGLPAGKREKNEKLEECATRELFEETGVEVNLSGVKEIFYYIPDDKQRDKIEEYCATFIVRSNKRSSDFKLAEANKYENGQAEGEALWVNPAEFIHSANSAFLDYNTNLLRFAKLI